MRLRVRVLLPLLALLGPGEPARGAPRASLPAPGTPFPYVRMGQVPPRVPPGERSVLTLEGRARPLTLTRTQLLSLPTVRYATRHAQLGRVLTYEGVPLRDLAVLGGFAGRDMRLYASNGYVTTISARDYLDAPIMLAHTANGRPIPVMEKGPLTVVLPDDPARFPRERYGPAWVWFVERITPAP